MKPVKAVIEFYFAYLTTFSENVPHSKEICGDISFMRRKEMSANIGADKDLIAKGRALYVEVHTVERRPEAIAELIDIVPPLADLAEQRGEMLIEYMAADRCTNYGHCSGDAEHREAAMKDLDIASSSWVHIGPDQKAAIEYCIRYLPIQSEFGNDVIQVLRGLIGESENESVDRCFSNVVEKA